MTKCKVCKQEILPSEQVVENQTDVHKNGACDVYLHETQQRINESTDVESIISETQLL